MMRLAGRGGPLRGMLLAAGAGAALTGCVGPWRGDDAALSAQVFQDGYADLAAYYVRTPDLRRLTLDAVASVHLLDPDLRLVPSANGTALLAESGGLVEKTFALPPDRPGSRAADWAEVAFRAAAWSYAHSVVIRDSYGWNGLRTVMLDAATASLDRYTHYAPPLRAQAVRRNRDGYAGLGITLEQRATGEDRFLIAEVMAGGPAAQAGVRPGDTLHAIDGHDLAALDLPAVRTLLDGPLGGGVTLTVRRPPGRRPPAARPPAARPPAARPDRAGDGGAQLRLTVVRERVYTTTVEGWREGDVGWLRIRRFNAGTAEATAAAIARLRATTTPPHAWVIDLRGNPGGLLDQAIAVAGMLLDRGTIVSTRGRHPESLQHYEAGGPGVILPAGVAAGDALAGQPLAVLVDGGTASAAEVLAAALVDNGRAPLIGSTTFGKGVVQTLARLPDGGEMSITWSTIIPPAGQPFNHRGLRPTLCTAGRDQVAAVLAELDSPPADAPPCPTGLRNADPLVPQVAMALLDDPPLRQRLASRLADRAPASLAPQTPSRRSETATRDNQPP